LAARATRAPPVSGGGGGVALFFGVEPRDGEGAAAALARFRLHLCGALDGGGIVVRDWGMAIGKRDPRAIGGQRAKVHVLWKGGRTLPQFDGRGGAGGGGRPPAGARGWSQSGELAIRDGRFG